MIPRTGLYTQLRYSPYGVGDIASTGTEISTGNYEFNVTGANLTKYLKCYVSTNNSTFEEYISYGGTDGISIINPMFNVVGEDIEITTDENLTLEGNTVDMRATVGEMNFQAEGTMNFTTFGDGGAMSFVSALGLEITAVDALSVTAQGGFSFSDGTNNYNLASDFGAPTSSAPTPANMRTVTLSIAGQEYEFYIKV